MSPTGTNYYVEDDPTCDNPAHTLTLHIGKSSGGWKFGFHSIPEKGLTSWAAWQEFLLKPGGEPREIKDEYDRVVSFEEFRTLVENKQMDHDRPPGHPNICHVLYMQQHYPAMVARGYFHDADNYDFHEGEFS